MSVPRTRKPGAIVSVIRPTSGREDEIQIVHEPTLRLRRYRRDSLIEGQIIHEYANLILNPAVYCALRV